MRTVELLGDDGLDRAVRAAWRRLDQAGFSSLAQHRHPTNQPHVTLASAEQFPPGASAGQFPPGAVAVIADALRVLPILVQLDRLHFFGGRTGMLAWAVDGGSALRELQAQVWSALDGTGRNPQHEPGAWTPHISLARRLLPGQVALAAQAVGETVAGGTLCGARSYDSVTRTVIPLPLSSERNTTRISASRVPGPQPVTHGVSKARLSLTAWEAAAPPSSITTATAAIMPCVSCEPVQARTKIAPGSSRASAGVPTATPAAAPGLAAIPEGQEITVDGDSGRIWVGELPICVTDESEDDDLRRLTGWAESVGPITVVSSADDAPGRVFDANAIPAEELDESLPAIAPGTKTVAGALFSTTDGICAALDAGVEVIVAPCRLPVLLTAITHSAGSLR